MDGVRKRLRAEWFKGWTGTADYRLGLTKSKKGLEKVGDVRIRSFH